MSAPTDTPGNTMMPYSLIEFPLIFISRVFLLVSQMLAREQVIAFFSPLTYYMDLVRYATGGGGSFSPYVDLAILVGFTGVFMAAVVVIPERVLTQKRS